jgi:acyl-CoA synthetase (AMP-forming)/AMP-acid ligase II
LSGGDARVPLAQSLEPPPRVDDLAPRGAARHPDAPAVTASDGALSYREVAAAVDGAAAVLRERGVRGGDRVLIVNENCAAALVLALAVPRIAAWPVLVNARLSAWEIEAIARTAPRRMLFTIAVSATQQHAERAGAAPVRWPAWTRSQLLC